MSLSIAVLMLPPDTLSFVVYSPAESIFPALGIILYVALCPAARSATVEGVTSKFELVESTTNPVNVFSAPVAVFLITNSADAFLRL